MARKNLKCFECGGRLKVVRKNYRYDECGLPNVVLVDVEARVCESCAFEAVVIPNIEGLHKTIAHSLARKQARLTGVEVKFLRKSLGLSGEDFAMRFHFDERRATQAAACLLNMAGGRVNYTKLLKILYIADRESLAETGAPITGAAFFNMKSGPVLSEVYDCVKSTIDCPYWSKHIQKTWDYDVELIADPGDDELSDFDVETLSRLHKQYRHCDHGGMIDVVHCGVDDETIAEAEARNEHVAAVAKMLRQSGMGAE